MEMKRCPFCGNLVIHYKVTSATFKKIGNKYFHNCECSLCHARVQGRDQFDALENWNRRYEDAHKNEEGVSTDINSGIIK